MKTILDATARVLSTEGFRAFNTNRVAKVAGVNIATVYRYFSTKEALVEALWHKQCEAMLAILVEAGVKMGAAPIKQAITHYVEGLLRFHAEDPALHHELRYAVAACGVSNPPEIDQQEQQLLRAYLELHRAELVPQDLDLAVFVLYSAVDHIINDALIKQPELLDDGKLEREIMALICGYLLPPQ